IGPSPWPKVFSLAAVLLLAATLGLVIYSVVPPSRLAREELSTVASEASSQAGAAGPVAGAAETSGPRATAAGDQGKGQAAGLASPGTAALADRVAAAAAAGIEPRGDTRNPVSGGSALAASGPPSGGDSSGSPSSPSGHVSMEAPAGTAGAGLAAATPAVSGAAVEPPEGQSPAVLLLEADDPVRAEREVSRVLMANSVQFSLLETALSGGRSSRGTGSGSPGLPNPVVEPQAKRDESTGASAARTSPAAEVPRAIDSGTFAAGPAPSAPANQTVFYAPRLSTVQFQAIQEALSTLPHARQQSLAPDELLRQQSAARKLIARPSVLEPDHQKSADWQAKEVPSPSAQEQLSQMLQSPAESRARAQEHPELSNAADAEAGQVEALTDVVIVLRGKAGEVSDGWRQHPGATAVPATNPGEAPADSPALPPATRPGP
ncbi:MAG: hypothetical protein NZ561_07760, partial [Phycisphaerae bacterium]|nr:hypothetical protein [Phycisphaerae bacterium]